MKQVKFYFFMFFLFVVMTPASLVSLVAGKKADKWYDALYEGMFRRADRLSAEID